MSRDDPLAEREEIVYDDIGDRPVSDLPAFPPEMMDAYNPPVTSSGRRLRRIANRTVEEMMVRVATGAQGHPTTVTWLDHHAHPGSHRRPDQRPTPSETGLVWVAAVRSPRVSAFISTARHVLANTELAHDA